MTTLQRGFLVRILASDRLTDDVQSTGAGGFLWLVGFFLSVLLVCAVKMHFLTLRTNVGESRFLSLSLLIFAFTTFTRVASVLPLCNQSIHNTHLSRHSDRTSVEGKDHQVRAQK